MNVWHDIAEVRIKPERFLVCIEISKGSQCKYELDKETGRLLLDRVLSTSTQYPANYGFIPLTYASDGDPLDALVLCQEPIVPLTLVECYALGVILMMDNGQMDEKVIAVPVGDPMWNTYKELSELPPHQIKEMSNFFEVYKMLEDKETKIFGNKESKDAREIIRQCIYRYNVEIKPRLNKK